MKKEIWFRYRYWFFLCPFHILFICNGLEYKVSYNLQDKYDDSKETKFLEFKFNHETASSTKSMKNLCSWVCENNEFMKRIVSDTSCEFMICSSALMDALEKTNWTLSEYGDNKRLQLQNTLSTIINQRFNPSLTYNNEVSESLMRSTIHPKLIIDTVQTYALIVPTTSRGYEISSFPTSNNGNNNDLTQNIGLDVTWLINLPLLQYLVISLNQTISASEASQLHLYLGYDEGDLVYDNPFYMNFIIQVIQDLLPTITIHSIRLVGLSGRIVHIWNYLTSIAARDNMKAFFLLNDDLTFRSNNWFSDAISTLNNNSFLSNFGSTSFYDEQQVHSMYPFFPSFPIFSQLHLDIFGKETAFDPIFVNSMADPWIYDVYVIFNSSLVLWNSKVFNEIGGILQQQPGTNPIGRPCRYDKMVKHVMGLETYIDHVQHGRRKVAKWLAINHSHSFSWTPASLAYGREGLYYQEYCSKDAPGCIFNAESHE
jgi:hypothetical protein